MSTNGIIVVNKLLYDLNNSQIYQPGSIIHVILCHIVTLSQRN